MTNQLWLVQIADLHRRNTKILFNFHDSNPNNIACCHNKTVLLIKPLQQKKSPIDCKIVVLTYFYLICDDGTPLQRKELSFFLKVILGSCLCKRASLVFVENASLFLFQREFKLIADVLLSLFCIYRVCQGSWPLYQQ